MTPGPPFSPASAGLGPADVADGALAELVSRLPGGGEGRAGQRTMARAVADAIDQQRHLVVQAGTGTGKSLAYLVPAVLSGAKVVVATATKALQDQLAGRDLPFLAEHLGADHADTVVSFAVLKGRSNYLCRQRIAELEGVGDQLALDGLDERVDEAQLAVVLDWAATTTSGDRAELPIEPSPATWNAVSVGARECPGRARCPQGTACFAEAARDAAAAVDVCVVNQHLYSLHLASGGGILPAHDLVVIDEAHQLEDIVAAAAGIEITPGRLDALGRTTRAILTGGHTDQLLRDLDAAAERLGEVLATRGGRRIDDGDDELGRAVALARSRTERVHHALLALPDDGPLDAGARKLRAVQAAAALLVDLDAVSARNGDDVVWVEAGPQRPALRLATLAVGDLLAESLWSERTAVLTSATIPANLPARVGLPPDGFDLLDVGSPFDYEHQALLYCAADLPDPRDPAFGPASLGELERLMVAAGGRTLALFTSYRAMREAAGHLRGRVPWPVLTQDDLPKPALLEAFSADDATSLLATMGFWQGVDVPGATLSLVVIDRLPFPRPDDPLLQARRDRAGAAAFREIDLPRAATLLAQGAGRLIRRASDRGVVAVLDRRLATSRSYRWDVVNALPPMRRTRDRDEALDLLRRLRDG